MKRLLTALVIFLAALAFPLASLAQAPAKPDIIELLPVDGEISDYMVKQITDAVDKINENAKIKGVLLVVNSPGGGARASAAIYQEIGKLKVPVVGFCESYCASGGAYVMMAPSVKYIVVRDEAIGGSIGVIAHMTRYNRLLDWAKIDNATFKSGALKDAGSPTRDMNEADRAYLQGIVDSLATKFYGVVVKARGDKVKANLPEIKTARIFIGDDIVRVGLADAVGEKESAVRKVKELSGSKNAYTREELTKMVRNANEAIGMSVDRSEPSVLERAMTHLDEVMNVAGEIRQGEAIRIEYRLPLQF